MSRRRISALVECMCVRHTSRLTLGLPSSKEFDSSHRASPLCCVYSTQPIKSEVGEREKRPLTRPLPFEERTGKRALCSASAAATTAAAQPPPLPLPVDVHPLWG